MSVTGNISFFSEIRIGVSGRGGEAALPGGAELLRGGMFASLEAVFSGFLND